MYELTSMTNERLKGHFYEQELSLVRGVVDPVYRIDHIIKEKSVKGKRMCLVRWLGFGPEHDSWEPKSGIAQQ